jgi:hypothetical protein
MTSDGVAFESPTGNITCSLSSESATCEILRKTFTPSVPKPSDCMLDYGHRLSVDAGGIVTFDCYGDSMSGIAERVLAYGDFLRRGRMTCHSEPSGITCGTETGAFKLSAQSIMVAVSRRLYFPLRSSVELFEDPTSVEASVRAKEGAVLFDEVLFEDGMVIATVGEQGNWTMYRPGHQLGADDLADTRRLAGPGEGFTIAVGAESTPGVAAEVMQPILQTKVVKSYAAEWHTSAIDDLAVLEVGWARFGSLSDVEMAKLTTPISQATRIFKEEAAENDLAPFQLEFAAKALAHDAVVAARIGAAINVTSLFSPMIEGVSAEPEATGTDALGILVPDLGKLSWNRIAEYREHPGSVEARAKLREFEQRALGQDSGDARDYLNKIKASITDDLMAGLAETEVKLSKAIAAEAVKAGVSFLPVIGPFIGPASTVSEALRERAEQRQRWYFALMKLRQGP